MKRRELLTATAASIASAAIPARIGAEPGAHGGFPLTPSRTPLLVAFVMGPHATIIDFAGPWEAFGDVMLSSQHDMKFGFEMAMVSDSKQPLNLSGMIVTPKYTYRDFPSQPNVIVVGAQHDHSPAKIAWIKDAARGADVVMSVCLGAFLLAKTGLLDGLKATTHHDAYDEFAKQFPRVHLVRGPRFVDNGKMATAGGESSGIDLAFHVVERYYGTGISADAADTMEFTRSTRRPAPTA